MTHDPLAVGIGQPPDRDAKVGANRRAHDLGVERIDSSVCQENRRDTRGGRSSDQRAQIAGVAHLIENEEKGRGRYGNAEFRKREDGESSLRGDRIGNAVEKVGRHDAHGPRRSEPSLRVALVSLTNRDEMWVRSGGDAVLDRTKTFDDKRSLRFAHFALTERADQFQGSVVRTADDLVRRGRILT